MIELIDTHQHLIYRDKATISWSAGSPVLGGRDFTLEDYKALTDGLGIAGTLFMEVDVDGEDIAAEARHIAALAADPASLIRGMVPACRPETDAGFDAWLEEGRALGAVGFRRILHEVPDDVSTSATFRANVRKIGAAGLTFDVCMHGRQLPLARELAVACDNTRIVLDHCGVPDIGGGELEFWREGIRALAELPNVTCKLSGILAYCPPRPATLATLRPYVDHVLASFGPERMLWGSDWPVVNKASGLREWIAMTREILAPLSPDEAAAIAHRTAVRVYRL